jgi:DNA-binding response OmpR family regulator
MVKEKILIADDDERLNQMLRDIFEMENYQVLAAYDGHEVISYLQKIRDIKLVILDVMMPGLDGWDILEYVHNRFDTKILVLTALGDEQSELKALRAGADDFVSKPFSRAVLLERAGRLVRERVGEEELDYVCGDIRIRPVSHKVYLGDQELSLTIKEYELLKLLMDNSGIVLPREAIIERIWGVEYDGNDRTVDTHIKMLRRSLGSSSGYIRTVRGVGYYFDGTISRQQP